MRRLILAILVVVATAALPTLQAQAPLPLTGPSEPRVAPVKGDDGLWRQAWYGESFLNLREDLEDARAKGKRFAVVFEQTGCIYCTKMHTEVLAERYINDYVRENYVILQLDLRGAREVTDFDGEKLAESRLAEKWGVMFTPWIVFYKDSLAGLEGKTGAPIEVTRMGLGMGAGTFFDMFVWIRAKVYETDRNFQRFHVARHAEREALEAHAKHKGRTN
jgi:thioredoxin-related protein